MKFFNQDIGRRQFISVSSMFIGAGMLAKPSRLLFAADEPVRKAEEEETDNTKYGKYILLSQKNKGDDHGIPVVNTMGMSGITKVIPGCPKVLIGRFPPPGPMPGHEVPEKHSIQEFLIHLGNDPDNPFDLAAESELYIGRGKWLEKHIITKTTAVYLPTGFWHCPWHVRNIRKPMSWVNVMIGGGLDDLPPGPNPYTAQSKGIDPDNVDHTDAFTETAEAFSATELAKAKTSGYLFDKFFLSGVGKDIKDPRGGKMLVYLDCTMIAEAPLARIIRYRPEEAPYSIINTQIHEYGTLLIHVGTDYDDPTDLGAEIELYMGEEKEKHTFNKSAIVYVPPKVVHGPLIVKNARKPFNFLEIVVGPELPGAVYG